MGGVAEGEAVVGLVKGSGGVEVGEVVGEPEAGLGDLGREGLDLQAVELGDADLEELGEGRGEGGVGVALAQEVEL